LVYDLNYYLIFGVNIMNKTIIALLFATVSLPALAGYHPIARTAAVATSDHPVAMAAATGGNGAHPVERGVAIASSDHPVAMTAATGNNGAHPIARTTVVATSDHPVAAAVVTGN
jgi:hypothetical protein